MASSPWYEQAYPTLFSPIKVRNSVYKNRIMAAPHGGSYLSLELDRDGYNRMSEFGIEFYGAEARGGAACVCNGEANVDMVRGNGHPVYFNTFTDETLPTLNLFTGLCHSYGAKAAIELSHCGEFAVPMFNPDGLGPIGPSAKEINGHPVEEMDEDEMYRVAQCFADAAHMMKRGGIDHLLIHGGHGWLLSEFLSPLENFRRDKYGGSLENRARFPMMVLDAIRKRVGEDMVLEYRISASELTPGNLSMEETIEFVKMIEDKIDILQCSAGVRITPLTRGIMHPTQYMPNGCNVYLAEAMKKGGVKIPVTAIGAINDPALAEQILAEGKADFVAMARSFLADPQWGEKARAGKAEDIRPCVKCLRCLDIFAGRKAGKNGSVGDDFENVTKLSSCSVNPEHGRAPFLFRYPAAERQKKVAVIGGGPAGMQAALKAAERGHKVTIYEKTSRLGGQLNFAGYVDFKEDLDRYRRWAVRQVRKNPNIEVLFQTEATPDMVGGKYDAVIVAIGADLPLPPIPGIDRNLVRTALDVFGKEDTIGDTVVVVGGGAIGVETAIHLANLGKKLHLIELGDILIREGAYTERLQSIHYLTHAYNRSTAALNRDREDPDRCRIHLETRVTEILEDGVIIREKEKPETFLPADTVVIATGMRSRETEREQFRGTAYDVLMVGDCMKVGDLYNATTTGYDAGLIL